MASTHSPDFLMGCVQTTKDVKVVRLEYSGGKSRGRVVDSEKLSIFLGHPLMRSTNVVAGLFYDGVVVTESDNDRVFYSEIFHRLTLQDDSLPSILFLNAQNKQTTREIIGPLREFGVPATAIVDIDFIKDGGADWLAAAQVPQPLHIGIGQQRSAVKVLLETAGGDMKRDGGVELLTNGNRLAADQLFDTLDDYGVFVVRRGEMEGWLPHLKVPGRKTKWTIAMLERLGSEPSNPDYVHPASGDVWGFVRKIATWIQNPSRRGLT